MSNTTTKAEPAESVPNARALEQRVLVLAPFGQDVPVVCQVLSEAGFDAESCRGVNDLCSEIERGAAAALLVEEALSAQARARITATLAGQPTWSDFPLLVMISRHKEERDVWRVLQGIGGTSHLTLLERPLHTHTLVSAVRVAVESRRRQYQVRDELAARQWVEEALRELNETLEAQVATRTAEAEQRARDLRRLAAELSEAEQRERNRLAKLLHDDLQQLLYAARLQLPNLVERPQDQLRQHVSKLDDVLRACLSTSRNLAKELSPAILQLGTLPEVVEWLGEWFGEKHGLAVTVDTAGEFPPDPEHLRVFLFQAVRELLFNVVKHSGRMEARVMLYAQQARLLVQVEDDGEGFKPEAVEIRLQQPEGFGLFNIQERLKALGGRLEIVQGPRSGACFRMIVPLAERAPLACSEPGGRAPTRAEALHAERSVVRLLVVDDHQVVREGFIGLLNSQKDFQVVGEAENGEAAIEQARVLRPDAIIMDVDMPTLNGIEATRQIKEWQPEIVIVCLSLHVEESVRRAITEAGADAYLSKHAPAKDLVSAIRRTCSRGARRS